jgi:hypothetical protein
MVANISNQPLDHVTEIMAGSEPHSMNGGFNSQVQQMSDTKLASG